MYIFSRLFAAAVMLVLGGCAAMNARPAPVSPAQEMAAGSSTEPAEETQVPTGSYVPAILYQNPPPPPPRPPARPAAVPSSVVGNNMVNATAEIVRYIGVSTSWSRNQVPQNLSDLYTRIEVYSDADNVGVGTPNAALRDYVQENRSWLARLLSSQTNTVTALANIEIKAPDMKTAIPLFSVSHTSGRDLGNVWTTNFAASDVTSPLFRIGPNTALTVHLNAKVSSDLKSQGASMVVGAVTQAVKIAAPSNTLLTSLSKTEVSNAAQAIDSTISGLFSQNISEDIDLGRLTDTWNPDARLILTGCAPAIRTDVKSAPMGCSNSPDLDGEGDVAVGKWTLRLRCPRISVIDPRDLCNDLAGITAPRNGIIPLTAANLKAIEIFVAQEVTDDEVLLFNLSSQVSVQAFVQTQEWYTNYIKLNKATATAADYTTFCTGAVSSLYANGLNKLDAALALRAMIEHMQGINTQKADFATDPKGAECRKLLGEANVSIN